MDVFGLLISCLCHDVNHPGNTNMYEVMTYSPLALLHNDHSVLENHHIVTTFTLIRKPENNFLQDFPVDQMRHIRKVIITNILGTDMSQHVELCKKMDKLKPKLESISLMVESDRMLLMEIMIHSGDLVAPILPLRSSLPWEARITKEFITQNILEKEKGLPLTAVMTDLTTPVIRGKKQVDFVDFIIIPLWRSVSEQFPEFKRCMSTIQLYRSHFLPLANANMKSAIVTNAAAFKTRTSNMEERLHEIEVMQRRLSVMAWQEERDEVGNSDGKEEGK